MTIEEQLKSMKPLPELKKELSERKNYKSKAKNEIIIRF